MIPIFEPTAKVICDSIAPNGKRLTTIEATMHRFVLAELNTHRAFSRNSASSRAIPISKTLKRSREIPAWPLWWGKNQSGMSATEELGGIDLIRAHNTWLELMADTREAVMHLSDIGLHKQLANRPLEWFMPHTVIISATEWDNFFWQRCHPAAQPEMKALADAIQLAYYTSTPVAIGFSSWHLPYIQPDEQNLPLDTRKRVSVARCSRVSYLTHDGKRDIDVDVEHFIKLYEADPMHSSPFEHVALPASNPTERHGNFKGWIQLRQLMERPVKPFKPNHPKLIGQTG